MGSYKEVSSSQAPMAVCWTLGLVGASFLWGCQAPATPCQQGCHVNACLSICISCNCARHSCCRHNISESQPFQADVHSSTSPCRCLNHPSPPQWCVVISDCLDVGLVTQTCPLPPRWLLPAAAVVVAAGSCPQTASRGTLPQTCLTCRLCPQAAGRSWRPTCHLTLHAAPSPSSAAGGCHHQ